MVEPDRDVCAKDLTKCEFFKKSGGRSASQHQGLTSRCKTCECGNGKSKCPIIGSSCRCVNGKVYEPDRDECAQDMDRCIFHGRTG
ncbi:hypothetical protein MTO96_015179 [Rhipicephalus appendiculatus]